MKHSDVKAVKFLLGVTWTPRNLKFTFLVAAIQTLTFLCDTPQLLAVQGNRGRPFAYLKKTKTTSVPRNWIFGLAFCFYTFMLRADFSLILLIHFGLSPVCIIQAHSIDVHCFIWPKGGGKPMQLLNPLLIDSSLVPCLPEYFSFFPRCVSWDSRNAEKNRVTGCMGWDYTGTVSDIHFWVVYSVLLDFMKDRIGMLELFIGHPHGTLIPSAHF